jgi:plasmid stabilization system protein ParE
LSEIKIQWLPQALADVERLDAFLRPKSPEAAARAIYTILDRIELLRTFPDMGRPMLEGTPRRELIVPFSSGAYIVRYIQENEATTVIIRIRYNREDKL